MPIIQPGPDRGAASLMLAEGVVGRVNPSEQDGTHRNRSARARRGPAWWLAMAVALNVALGMAYSVIALRNEADTYREVEALSSRISERSSLLDGLAWRALGHGRPDPGLDQDIARVSDQVEASLRELGRLADDVGLFELPSILQVAREHLQSIDEQVRLLAAGDHAAALRVGEQTTSPTLSRLRRSTESARSKYADLARRSSRIADIESVVMMGLGAVLATLLFRRFVWARRAADVRTAQLRAMVEHVPAIVYTAEPGPSGRWLYVSPQIESLLGFTPQEWMADPDLWFRQVHQEDQARVTREEEAEWTGRTPGGASEYRMMTKDGRVVWIRDVGAVISGEDGQPLFWSGVLSDITDRKVLEEQLEHQAFHDTLTGLANRALFLDRVEHALARGARDEESAAVLFLDLDDFKTINDSLGHAAGDRVLVAVAGRLEQLLRPVDTIARLGGDEFAILLEEASVEDAIRVVERILESLEEPLWEDRKPILVRASYGIAVAYDRTLNATDLLRNADVAMYAAKARGKGRFEVFQPDMHVAALKRLEIEAELQRAIKERQFVLHYQPIFELDTGRIVSLEALIRWERPEGLVSPATFIPVAEESDLIIQIGRWVLEEACRQVAEWHRAYPTTALGVNANVSGRQFHSGLVDEVSGALRASGIDPTRLTLEITESVLVQDTEAAVARLQDLKGLGVQVALDDFGTGYSSLGYLKRFPIDTLKIDKSFVDGIGEGAEGSALVRAILSLGDSLSLGVSAEGIESEEQLAVLQALRCRWGQGFFFARPMDAQGIRSLLGRQRSHRPGPGLSPVDAPIRSTA